jgi:mono/diheme cytochrome c family protein
VATRGAPAAAALALALGAGAGSGCRQDMHDQPRYKPLGRSDFFDDERAARPLVAGTIARGHLRDGSLLYTGKAGAAFADALPMPLTPALLRRGKERFEIFCVPCHGPVGLGDGMIVRRGFKKAASFQDPRLRETPVGYFFDVMTHGFGAMLDYSAQIPVEDRWAIAAYIRALQLSQHATLDDVPAEERARLEAEGGPPAP